MRHRTRRYADDVHCIDLKSWKPYLRNSTTVTVRWSSNGQTTGHVEADIRRDHVTLRYLWSEIEDIKQRVPLIWTPCRFGGERAWFICDVSTDGRYCGRRVTKLYGAGKWFACRRCYELHYACQSEGLGDRCIRAARTIRSRLGGGLSVIEPLPRKPWGMHWRTYRRLCGRAEHADWGWSHAIDGWVERAARLRVRR